MLVSHRDTDGWHKLTSTVFIGAIFLTHFPNISALLQPKTDLVNKYAVMKTHKLKDKFLLSHIS